MWCKYSLNKSEWLWRLRWYSVQLPLKQIDYFHTNLDLPCLLRILGCHQLQPLPSVQEDREVPAYHLRLKDKHESTSTELMYMQNETLYFQWQVNTDREIYKILLTTLTRPTIKATLSSRPWESRYSFFTWSAWLTCARNTRIRIYMEIQQAWLIK